MRDHAEGRPSGARLLGLRIWDAATFLIPVGNPVDGLGTLSG